MGDCMTGRSITCPHCDWLNQEKRHSDWSTETVCSNVVVLSYVYNGERHEAEERYSALCGIGIERGAGEKWGFP